MKKTKNMSALPSMQPHRLWYEFLKVALKHNLPVDKKKYKDWDLSTIKSTSYDKGFDKWYKTHKHLFYEYDTELKLVSAGKKAEPDTILVQIPTNFNVRRVQADIGEIVSKHLSKSNAKYKITSKRPLIVAPFDYMRWCWIYRQMPQFDKSVRGSLTLIHEQLQNKQENRTARLKKKRRVTKRQVFSPTQDEQFNNTSITVSKNVRKSGYILDNVCKGIFPGDYSIS